MLLTITRNGGSIINIRLEGKYDSWTENACGEHKFSDWTSEDLRLILPGISYFADKLKSVVSKQQIHIIINSDMREDVTNGIIDICRYYNIGYTLLHDIEKVNGHPAYNGMTEIKNQGLHN